MQKRTTFGKCIVQHYLHENEFSECLFLQFASNLNASRLKLAVKSRSAQLDEHCSSGLLIN